MNADRLTGDAERIEEDILWPGFLLQGRNMNEALWKGEANPRRRYPCCGFTHLCAFPIRAGAWTDKPSSQNRGRNVRAPRGRVG
jgi:hypothetical protein